MHGHPVVSKKNALYSDKVSRRVYSVDIASDYHFSVFSLTQSLRVNSLYSITYTVWFRPRTRGRQSGRRLQERGTSRNRSAMLSESIEEQFSPFLSKIFSRTLFNVSRRKKYPEDHLYMDVGGSLFKTNII